MSTWTIWGHRIKTGHSYNRIFLANLSGFGGISNEVRDHHQTLLVYTLGQIQATSRMSYPPAGSLSQDLDDVAHSTISSHTTALLVYVSFQEPNRIQGLWNTSVMNLNINCLEIKAIFYALRRRSVTMKWHHNRKWRPGPELAGKDVTKPENT